ncbi:hypothetical protein [Oceanirhabdus sp. W0125-5]|uniref:hypothetical protein n=1 Tax=Oceanirhabdus sp. W0125-5 TaxID=2999116 RepID=UPI0022F2F691|nr:hypothetical protein [Oceanirhabdus sp. W0125-5]WBW99498.1 hypothetical protein OW730_12340 [Oceanirhabdus sp. W0125-5]
MCRKKNTLRMNKKNVGIMIIVLVVLLVSATVYVLNRPTSKITMSYLTDNKMQLDMLNDLEFVSIYGAPQYFGYDSYVYNDKKFTEYGEYIISTEGPIDSKLLEDFIKANDSIKNHTELEERYGQISLVETIDDYTIIVCDGYFVTAKSKEMSSKTSTIFKYNNKDSTYEEYSVESEKLLFFNELSVENNTIYLVGVYEDYDEDETIIYETVLYKITSNSADRYMLYSNRNIIFWDSYYMCDDLFFTIYLDEENQANIVVYDLENMQEIDRENINNYIKEYINKSPEISYSAVDDRLYTFYNIDDYLEVLIFSFDNDELSMVERDKIELPHMYRKLSKAFEYDGRWFLFFEDRVLGTTIFEYDVNKGTLNKLIQFNLKDDNLNIIDHDFQ